jgi:acyl-CoA dehydrogenase
MTEMEPLLNGLMAPSQATGKWESTAWRIGEEVAAVHAEEVDRESRFPQETVDEYRRSGLLAALVPTELGGGGATLPEIVGAVRAIAFHCVSSALVLAMHTIEVSNLVRHGTTEAHRRLMAEIASDALLIANANSEVGIGGDVGRSKCAVEPHDGGFRLVKEALAISYGEYADVIVATARRTPDSAETDQVQVIIRKADVELERTSTWDATGLRGTCSNGFRLTARIDPELIHPKPFAEIASQGGVQATTLLLSGAWVGLAEAAGAKAHAFVRASARRSIGTLPAAAPRLSSLAVELEAGRALLASAAQRFVLAAEAGEMEDPEYIATVRGVKVGTSEMAVRIATEALSICGIAGFKRDTPFAMDRHIRDAHGGIVMVSNERYLRANAEMLVARKHL